MRSNISDRLESGDQIRPRRSNEALLAGFEGQRSHTDGVSLTTFWPTSHINEEIKPRKDYFARTLEERRQHSSRR
jgi:hypothetical protein